MKIPIFQVDAFTDRLFKGNPAAVCPLDEWLSDEMLQNIALENNLSETAFFVKEADKFHIRWFTPETEVSLCGHATLASAAVLFVKLGYKGVEIQFNSKSGMIKTSRNADRFVLDFPSDIPKKTDENKNVSDALGMPPYQWMEGKEDLFLIYEKEEDIKSLDPDFATLRGITQRGVIVTARGSKTDFVSRFFAPAAGINEDPVTGSAHTTLTPYWSARLKKKKLTARQISLRGGFLVCVDKNDRVDISGNVAFYMQGIIEV